jgi:hypothetical protein
MGAIGDVWAGPVGVAVGALVGGALGALLSDHAYVEATGTSNPATRQFVARFTSFWAGVDEKTLARALATENRSNLSFVRLVLLSLDQDYHTDETTWPSSTSSSFAVIPCSAIPYAGIPTYARYSFGSSVRAGPPARRSRRSAICGANDQSEHLRPAVADASHVTSHPGPCRHEE